MAIGVIFGAFSLTLGQLDDPRFRRVLFIGIGLTFALLIAVTAAFLLLVGWWMGPETSLPLIGEVRWLDDFAFWGSLLLMMGLSVFLMVPVASAMISFFLDDVAQAVEDKHYPELPPVGRQSVAEMITDTLSFLGVIVVVNLFALVLYIIFAPLALFIFWAVNGLLLGREYFTLAAMRRVGREEATRLRKRHMGTIWLAGVFMAMPLSVPLLNLVVPILGAAAFTHIFHALRDRAPVAA
ncbi:EI24 domain-containing protein [Pseudooceanicola sp. LIPI14-2-Ac024]|uniref:EI24 domain-containing protein n=1 Tax=Pseudooceanicola sp. LIPI14-2-Ac024 TaxID=3344875 RepID=UPI0035CFB8A4